MFIDTSLYIQYYVLLILNDGIFLIQFHELFGKIIIGYF